MSGVRCCQSFDCFSNKHSVAADGACAGGAAVNDDAEDDNFVLASLVEQLAPYKMSEQIPNRMYNENSFYFFKLYVTMLPISGYARSFT